MYWLLSVDYVSSATETESNHRRGQSHDEIEILHGRGRPREMQGSSQHRSILRGKVQQTGEFLGDITCI